MARFRRLRLRATASGAAGRRAGTGAVAGNVQRLGLVVVVCSTRWATSSVMDASRSLRCLSVRSPASTTMAEQDLDVDLVVRAVHTGRVVDGIGVDQATFLRVFDAAVLRAAQVAAFGQHLAAQLAAVDAEGVTGLVAHLGVGFALALT
jgi:hypothetical protein